MIHSSLFIQLPLLIQMLCCAVDAQAALVPRRPCSLPFDGRNHLCPGSPARHTGIRRLYTLRTRALPRHLCSCLLLDPLRHLFPHARHSAPNRIRLALLHIELEPRLRDELPQTASPALLCLSAAPGVRLGQDDIGEAQAFRGEGAEVCKVGGGELADGEDAEGEEADAGRAREIAREGAEVDEGLGGMGWDLDVDLVDVGGG